VKRFRGRRKDLLREAERRVLPAAIADRTDNGIFNELLFDGLARRESARVQAALAAAGEFPGIDGNVLRFEAERWLALEHQWGTPILRAITVGLWLDNLGVSRSPHSDRRQITIGKEVRT
jgi:hypothetical protein